VRNTQRRTGTVRGRDRVRLRQLFWTLTLFVCLLLGKRFYPRQLLQAGERVLGVVSGSVEFDTAFSRLGAHMAESGNAVAGLREFCACVFGPGGEQEGTEQAAAVFSPQLPSVHSGLLCEEIRPESMFAALCTQTREMAVPAAGTVLIAAPEPEQALPEGHTMDKLSLGTLKTVSPVVGELNSGFGYRAHPVNGKYLFHSGVDINAELGDPIAAFADGEVEYLGEDGSYGLYLQLDHGNGIKSFYAHCRSLCVQTGQWVRAGETVALVGDTGTATGPHLHLELKCGNTRVDPAWYVELIGA